MKKKKCPEERFGEFTEIRGWNPGTGEGEGSLTEYEPGTGLKKNLMRFVLDLI